MTASDPVPIDVWHFLGFVALLIFVIWFARVWWQAVEARRHLNELGVCESCHHRVPRLELGLIEREGGCHSVCATCAGRPR